MDVFETDEAVVVRLELAGVRGEDVKVQVDGELLKVSGVRRVPSEPRAGRLHRMEIAFGPFHRDVRISIPFDRERVGAHLEDGLLTVTLPKRLPARRDIEIE